MTAATITATGVAVHRPRGYWATWRLHRLGLFGSAGGLLILLALLLLTSVKIRGAYHTLGLAGCGSQCTSDQIEAFSATVAKWGQWSQFIIVLPGLLGMFLGAPLIAREYETGTFRFAWTQGINPRRLVLTKLILIGSALVVATLGLSAVFHWWYTPMAERLLPRITIWPYPVDGVYLAAATLYCFAFGVLAGAVIRRTIPAMLATGAAWLGTYLVDLDLIRPRHYRAPLLTAGLLHSHGQSAPVWVLDTWYTDQAGHRISGSAMQRLISAHPADPKGFLRSSGYTAWVTYQPANRFWLFQTLDATWLVGLALVFGLLTLWWLRRRPT